VVLCVPFLWAEKKKKKKKRKKKEKRAKWYTEVWTTAERQGNEVRNVFFLGDMATLHEQQVEEWNDA
jgi:hypothetical protein